jgi:hypothetical protein
VVERLSGGAHLLIPSDGTIAVRAYYPTDLQRLNNSDDWKEKIEAWNQGRILDDVENLASFRDSFQFPFVFFVLPSSESVSENLDQAGSFIHQAQMLMNGWGEVDKGSKSKVNMTLHRNDFELK